MVLREFILVFAAIVLNAMLIQVAFAKALHVKAQARVTKLTFSIALHMGVLVTTVGFLITSRTSAYKLHSGC